ncbi:glyoxalase [cyanobacterium TDX16]|nr:glyoxalase [cyanobacterium TDX16]
MAAPPPLFHLAFPVVDLERTRRFYVDVLGCRVGRTSDRWIDFDFGGHQITAHLRPEEAPATVGAARTNAVDGHDVPVRHFGLIVDRAVWDEMAERLRADGTDFVIEPYVRFAGEVGEQATMFFLDPSGNAIEVKSFLDRDQVFAAADGEA